MKSKSTVFARPKSWRSETQRGKSAAMSALSPVTANPPASPTTRAYTSLHDSERSMPIILAPTSFAAAEKTRVLHPDRTPSSTIVRGAKKRVKVKSSFRCERMSVLQNSFCDTSGSFSRSHTGPAPGSGAAAAARPSAAILCAQLPPRSVTITLLR